MRLSYKNLLAVLGLASAIAVEVFAVARSDAIASSRTQLTAYPSFKNVCSTFVVGYQAIGGGARLSPKWGRFFGSCHNVSAPILFGVTHENDKNNHNGSANYDPNIGAYMADLDVEIDPGRWLKAGFAPYENGSVLAMALDTVNYRQINVTGWPLQFGHLFLGANDLSVKATLDKSVFVDFDIRILKEEVALNPFGYSGHRIMAGAQLLWDETVPRTNKTHFLEIDLIQSDGYSESYGDPKRPLCRDAIYDRCFYSDNGQYAEGREVSYESFLKQVPIPTNTDRWVQVHIPLSEICKKLNWVSRAGSWSAVKLNGLYIGIESEGATQATFEMRNYQVYATD
jgi:hypothetical protein